MPLDGLQLGHYRLVRSISSGGMGEVYLAADTRIKRQVAIKVVRTEAAPHSDAQASKGAARLFQREMKAIAILDHPHILPLYDFGEESINRTTLMYLVMPYRQEGSLADWLQEHGSSASISSRDIWHLIQQAASALQHAHNRQIIHQDVKPSNFLIHRNDEYPNRPDLLLADFGVAKFTSATSSTSQTIRGTPTYMAPEQWSGEPVAATDQYALAIMAYELLTGRPPFQGPPMRLMFLHATVPPQPPSALNPRISPALDAVILRALAKKPSDRFPSISAFAQAFQEALQGTDIFTVVKPPHSSDPHATLATSEAQARAEENALLIVSDSGGTTVPLSHPKLFAATPFDPNPHLPSTVQASTPNLQQTVAATPSRSNQEVPARVSVSRGITASRLPSLRVRIVLLIGLALLLIASSAGIFSFIHANQVATSNPNATATTVASNATGTITALFNAVTATAQANATVIAANPDPYSPPVGTLALYDPLRDNSQGNGWDTAPQNGSGYCEFIGGAYEVIQASPTQFYYCLANATDFSNFAYEVQMTIIKGGGGGIVFRVDSTNETFYRFDVYQDGHYQVLLCPGNGNNCQALVTTTSSSAIKQGLNQTNIIAVVANGTTFTFYVNHQRVTSFNDPTFSHGAIGVTAIPLVGGQPTEVAYSNARVWTFW